MMVAIAHAAPTAPVPIIPIFMLVVSSVFWLIGTVFEAYDEQGHYHV
jgi:hypothetical protein